jgi:pyruvate/2-oxoglutarate dehydrogenase complex dihydrolipoamide acyltransferase (E2) component
MLRPLLAGGVLLALASAGASQSMPPQDDALSPMEIIANLAKQPAASETTKAPGPEAQPSAKDAAKKPAAAAKPDAAKKPDAAATKATAAKRDADSLEQCLNDWDKGTHMTRAEWARTCRRVVTNRARFLSEQQGK